MTPELAPALERLPNVARWVAHPVRALTDLPLRVRAEMLQDLARMIEDEATRLLAAALADEYADLEGLASQEGGEG